jgi:hypothetical protein
MFHDRNKATIGQLIEALTHDETVQKLMAYSLGRVLLNETRGLQGILDLDMLPEYEHIRDWLLAAVRNDEKWIQAVDEQGRPKKLMKFGSIDAIVAEADKAMKKFAQKNRQVRISDGDERMMHELSEGWYVVRLLTPTALDRESGEMQHCIGQGGYDEKLTDPAFAYYSLRDPFGKAHATMEVSVPKGVPLQLQGKQNEEPIPEYLDRLLEFMKVIQIVPVQLSRKSRWVFDEDHKRHDIENLPDGVKLLGSISVVDKTISFPRHFSVRGDLKISGSYVSRMPKELIVGGEYSVENSELDDVPQFMKVGGDIRITRSRCDIAERVDLSGRLSVGKSYVSRLPHGLNASNSVNLTECLELTNLDNLTSLRHLFVTKMPSAIRLPDGLELGSLEIVNTEFVTFPSNITVKGYIDLYNTGLTELPEGLIVNGSLDVGDNPLTRLPKGLRVESHLTFSRTKIASLPSDLIVGGSIIASDTPLRSLGSIREVNGQLAIAKTQIEELPDGLSVKQDLDAAESELKRIGSGVRIGQSLHIRKTDVTELPFDIVIEDELDASYSSLQCLPEGFEAKGNLRLQGSDLRSLPEGLHVWGYLNISNTPITEFPVGVIIEGDFQCTGTRLNSLAIDTVVKGTVGHPLGNSIFPQPKQRMISPMARTARK